MWQAQRIGDFGAEIYLRLAGERILLGQGTPEHGGLDSRLLDAARALVTVDAIDPEAAQQIIDDYTVVGSLRGRAEFRHMVAMRRHRSFYPVSAGAAPAATFEERRAALCDYDIEVEDATHHIGHVTLADHQTTVAITGFRRNTPPQTAGSGASYSLRTSLSISMGGGWTGGRARAGGDDEPPDLTITDDQGTTTTAHFGNGEGSETQWSGVFFTGMPLSVGTAWIEIEGHRIPLRDERPDITVAIESLAEQHLGLRHLWHRLGVQNHFHNSDDLGAAIDALVAAGAIAVDDPALADVRSVQAAVRQGPGGTGGRALPQPWRSMFTRRARNDGPQGEIVVETTTPVFDGVAVRVSTIESEPSSFRLAVETLGVSMPTPFAVSVDAKAIAWWAADDRGNHYLGEMNGWSGGNGQTSGTLEFPAIDPKAKRLDLMPSTENARAVIGVPLDWKQRRER